MKPLLIDDLIGDTYALLYTTIGPALPPLPSEQPQHPAPPLQPVIAQHSSGMPISSLMQVQIDGAGDPTNRTPFAIYHPSQILPQPPQVTQPEAAPKPRAKAVGRREIQRRAEGCIQKPVTATASTTMAIRSPATTHATPPIFQARASSPERSTQAAFPSDALAPSFDKSGSATAAASLNNDDVEPEPSAPTSVHDDADDESELSEIDEEQALELEGEIRRSAELGPRKSLFPNLIPARRSVDKGEGEADTIRVKVPGEGAGGSGEGR
jgi:hypothetical protein